MLALVITVKELPVEQLHCNDGKYDLQQKGDDNDRHLIFTTFQSNEGILFLSHEKACRR